VDLKQAKRILIIGISGAGKTTLARALGKTYKLPVIHLDQHFWLPGWKMPDPISWEGKLEQLSSGEC